MYGFYSYMNILENKKEQTLALLWLVKLLIILI